MSPTAIESDYTLLGPDAHVIARDMLGRTRKPNIPAVADLASAITGISLTESMKQINNIVVTMHDPEWAFMDSGFFDADENGDIDEIDVNYPDGSRYWWRLTEVEPHGADHSLSLTFLVREAVDLMRRLGPAKANRAQMTRAQFLKMLAKKVPTIEFYSRELDIREPTAKASASSTASSSQAAAGQGSKAGGLGANTSGLTAKGVPLSRTQVAVINTLLSVAERLKANLVAATALIYAAIWESDLDPTADNGTYWGVLSSRHNAFAQHDTAGMATAFLKGDSAKGFQAGGAIFLSTETADVWGSRIGPITNPAEIAVKVEAPSQWPTNAYATQHGYPGDATAIAEARKIVLAGGGAGQAGVIQTDHTVTTIEAYYFDIAPKEQYWAGMTRLSQQVNWDLFWDGSRLYYDSEQSLIKQRPAAVIGRHDIAVVDWDYKWDTRMICTQMSLTLIEDMFGLAAGEVLELHRFGTASTGSTAHPTKLPGRWLIQDKTRNKGDLTSILTLIQPDLPKLEPAPKIVTTTVKGQKKQGPFAHPFPNGWIPNRLDLGFDGTFTDVIVAPFDGIITYAADSFSNWGGYIELKATNIPDPGPGLKANGITGQGTDTFYFAEGVSPAKKTGTRVKAGDVIANAARSPYGNAYGTTSDGTGQIEWGLAQPGVLGQPTDPMAKGMPLAQARQLVLGFAQWVENALGVKGPTETSHAGFG